MNKLILCLLLAVNTAYSADQSVTLQEFGGKVTTIAPDKIPDKYSPEILNGYTDELNMFIKRQGTTNYITTPLSGNPIKQTYVYTDTSGKSYLIANSSNSVFYIDAAGWHVITNTLNERAIDDYTTAGGVLYRDNGVDGLGSKWDGTNYTALSNVTNSTQMVSGKYIEYWNNRLWKIGAHSSFAYYSRVNNPQYFDQNYQVVNINVNDGDYVTGTIIWNDRFIVTKTKAVYEIYEAQPGNFLLRRLYNGIGCLYNTSMDVLPTGTLAWMSHRGIEEFTGNSFNLISNANDEYVKTLEQLKLEKQLTYTDTTALDFGKGYGVGFDTTSFSGSIVVASRPTTSNQSNFAENADQLINSSWQEIQSSMTGIMQTISFKTGAGNGTGTIQISSGMRGAGTQIFNRYISFSANTFERVDVSTYNIIISSGLTESLKFSTSGGNWRSIQLGGGSGGPYTRGKSSFNDDADFVFNIEIRPTEMLYISTAVYFNTVTTYTWTSWNTVQFTSTVTANPGSEFYYLRFSTSLANITSIPLSTSTVQQIIMSTTGAYVQYVLWTTSPALKIDQVDITAIGEGNPPYGKVYDRRYWLAVSTDATTDKNNVVMVYQKNNEWTEFNGLNIGAMSVMNNKLYYGDSRNSGYIYQTDVPNVYLDNGITYESHRKSKIFDFGMPLSDKIFKTMWVYGQPLASSSTITISYALNSENTFTDKNFTLMPGGDTVMQKIQFPAWTKGTQIQFKVGDNDKHDFRFKRIDLLYEVLQPR